MNKLLSPPAILKEAGWSEINHLPFGIGSGRNLFNGEGTDKITRIKFFCRDADKALVGKVWFGSETQGPPGHVHGGAMSYVLDEALGTVCWLAGLPSVAARLEFDYINLSPINFDFYIEATVDKVDGKKIFTTVKIFKGEKVIVKGVGIFIKLAKEVVENFLSQRNLSIDLSQYQFADD